MRRQRMASIFHPMPVIPKLQMKNLCSPSKSTLDRDGNAIVELIYDDFLKNLVSYAKEREAQDEE